MNKKTFRSRISVLLIGLLMVIFIQASIPMFQYKIYQGMYILGGALLLIIFLFTGMRYVISDNRLYLKMWFIPNGSIKIEDIISMERSYNPLSAPAGSLKRLCIRLGDGAKYPSWLISPVKEQEFIQELKAVNPDIDVNVPVRKGIWRFWDWDI